MSPSGSQDAPSPFVRKRGSRPRRTAADGTPLKSVRAIARGLEAVPDVSSSGKPYDPVDERMTQLEMYKLHLQTEPSNRGRPFSQGTIGAYTEAVRSLGVYLTSISFTWGYERVTHEHINAYLAAYYEVNGLGGTATKLGSLRHFFGYLSDLFAIENAYEHPKRHTYIRGKESPETLPPEFISDILKATSGSAFEDLRDNLIIRTFLAGPRNCEVAGLQVEDLNLRESRIRFPPKKWSDTAREVPVPSQLAKAAVRYLNARAHHKSRPPARSGPLFLSAKRVTPMTGSGIYQMLRRRAEQAGYDPSEIHPHLFRHTAADTFLEAGGSEGDALHLFGWEEGSRSMLDRYARKNRARRAIKHATELGFGRAPGE